METLAERGRFSDPLVTADGQQRASVRLQQLTTLWFNTGTLCNIECRNCYIESSPVNDRLAYLTSDEMTRFLDEVAELRLGTREIGFTGGEPFLNPDLPEMIEVALDRGFEVLVLTNAMRPLQRPAVQARLETLRAEHGEKLALRVSLDHYTARLHEQERGRGSWSDALRGLGWLARRGFRISVAGRSRWGEPEAHARRGYRELFARRAIPVDADDPGALVIFPEMDPAAAVPEITVDCWQIVGVDPGAMMCASSRMVVKRKGASPTVVACTLLPYDRRFELAGSLREARDPVPLNHPYCAQFCVLGGGSCAAPDPGASRR